MTRVAGSLQKSGEVMKLVNGLMKVPALQRTMMDMSRGERMHAPPAHPRRAPTAPRCLRARGRGHCVTRPPPTHRTHPPYPAAHPPHPAAHLTPPPARPPMRAEMTKAGVIEEMMNDALEGVTDSEDLEEESEAQVDKILMEVAGETLEQMAAAPQRKQQAAATQQQQPAEAEAEEDGELDELQARLAAVKG